MHKLTIFPHFYNCGIWKRSPTVDYCWDSNDIYWFYVYASEILKQVWLELHHCFMYLYWSQLLPKWIFSTETLWILMVLFFIPLLCLLFSAGTQTYPELSEGRIHGKDRSQGKLHVYCIQYMLSTFLLPLILPLHYVVSLFMSSVPSSSISPSAAVGSWQYQVHQLIFSWISKCTVDLGVKKTNYSWMSTGQEFHWRPRQPWLSLPIWPWLYL